LAVVGVIGLIAMVSLLAIMTIILAVLGLVVVKALAESPWGLFTIAATIPLAMIMGIAIKSGKVGLSEVEQRPLTRPYSPQITRPRPPNFPEPIKIPQTVSC
jgi:hypothetical protein